ncbi:hypothetical protein BJX61DRAFT_529919 [Aspergillus egyptiacus]|nr:hypothetical protein BJX61DRAFT_529919 [Aspergillus egyptiacus]
MAAVSRPHAVRADTLDLQDHHAPSAKDHSRPVHTSEGTGLAPHQEQEIRHADYDSKAEILHGPRSHGYNDGADIYDDTEDIQIGLGMGQDASDTRGQAEDIEHSEEDDDDLLDDELMDKISSSPSIDDDDIDFEFVYALHNFVATVDGQANAAKGDNMVLLDDSNSYWWLVRIVKDGSIGYLPAEHIETPTERLARLNKHRNVDLSATMLGDNSEKSKNPLKKAMRRRNAKTVAFTSPTYIEASDVDYSTEEEDDDVSFTDEYAAREQHDARDEKNEDIVVEPLRPKSQRNNGSGLTVNIQEAEDSTASLEKQRSSDSFEGDEPLSPSSEVTVSRSRNGTVRNTDSFFKDDTVETKKISLTPNLLRDEIGGSSNEPKEPRISLEALDKTNSNEKVKDDKKKKDKKPGMLSGLFKRKDKKNKGAEDDGEDVEKHSNELSRSSPTPKTSSDSVSSPETRSANQPGPQRQTIKLQKQAPEELRMDEQSTEEQTPARENQKPEQTIRQVVLDEVEEIAGSSRPGNYEVDRHAPSSPVAASSPIKKVTSPIESPHDWRDPSSQGPYVPHSVTSPPQKFPPKQGPEYQTRALESPVSPSSPLEHQRPSPGVPELTGVLSPTGDNIVSPESPSSPADSTDGRREESASTPFEVPTPTWSDASLRSYLEDDKELRDLYVIVYDNTNIPPAGPDHPITGNLFKDESKRLREMNNQLDTMLSDWVSRKVRRSMSQ